MNTVEQIGRLARDPEYTPKNGDKKQYAKFTIAVDNKYNDLASFFNCIAFGVLADLVDKYLTKGRLVAVKGRHEQGEPYTDSNGKKRRSWTLFADEVEFLDSKKRDKSEAPVAAPAFEDVTEDIPF